ncbi:MULTISPECIES: hypothetical protein [Sphingomonas]|uniref:hypothetical protein n=1 Tax=Sphingomonas TaxID=13687 RepID=UPI000DF01E7F|nr:MULTISPECIES: hypothetical protein [Sphingomonas]
MSLLNGILGQVTGSATVQNLAEKVGLSPEQVEQAVTALGAAHTQEGDTVETAADQTGLPQDKLQEIVGHIGGEGSLGQFASLLGEEGGVGGMIGKIKGMF